MTVATTVRHGCCLLALAALTGAAPPPAPVARSATVVEGARPDADMRGAAAYASRYRRVPAPPTVITDVTLLDGVGGRLDGVDLFIENGLIRAVGRALPRPRGARIIPGAGRWLTPGLIDVHTHAGTFLLPHSDAEAHAYDVSELADPNQADVWIEHAVRTTDPVFRRALAGGVTALQILPGSANVFGGRAVVVKPIAVPTLAEMKFPDQRQGMKMACGSNPTSSFGSRGRGPNSRGGALALMRRALIEAAHHRRRAQLHALDRGRGAAMRGGRRFDGPPGVRPDELKVDALAHVLDGDLLVHVHCYRADDMATILSLADEFGFRVTAFHHATEAYKIAPLLVKHGTCVAVWPDWWGFKREAEDAVPENAAFVDAVGGCVAMHSDIPVLGDKLNLEAAKAMAAGRRAGLTIAPERAIRWITGNAAKMLGLEARIGRVAPGYNADLVLWSGDPFSARTHPELVFIDGAIAFDRKSPSPSDFELGRPEREPAP